MKNKVRLRKYAALAIVACALVTISVSCKKDAADSARWVVEKQGVRMREAPDASGKLIAVVPYASKMELVSEKNESLTIAGATGKWTEVKWNEKKGWVFGGFLGRNDPKTTEIQDRPDLSPAEYNEIRAAVEKYYSANNPKYLEVIRNEGLRIQDKMGNFAVVETGNDEAGKRFNELYFKQSDGWIRVKSVSGPIVRLLKLNRDNDVDAVSEEMKENVITYTIYLGKGADSFDKIHSVSLRNSEVKLGSCGEMVIKGTEWLNGVECTITFDCATNQVKESCGQHGGDLQ